MTEVISGPTHLTTQDLLRKHKVSHTNIDMRKHACPQCGVKVINLKQHERTVHQKFLHIPCTEKDCKTMFVTIYHLKQHIKNVHEKAKLACPQCEMMLGVDNLKRHIRIVHEKRRDHICF